MEDARSQLTLCTHTISITDPAASVSARERLTVTHVDSLRRPSAYIGHKPTRLTRPRTLRRMTLQCSRRRPSRRGTGAWAAAPQLRARVPTCTRRQTACVCVCVCVPWRNALRRCWRSPLMLAIALRPHCARVHCVRAMPCKAAGWARGEGARLTATRGGGRGRAPHLPH